MRIVDAIAKVMKDSGKPLTHVQIYNLIKDKKLFNFGAKDPKSVVRGKIRTHCFGLDFPSSSPVKLFKLVDQNNSKATPLYELFDREKATTVTVSQDAKLSENNDLLIEEVIHNGYKDHIYNIKTQLLNKIKIENPAFFEELVVKLLLKMGYGWNDSSSGRVIGGSGDEGIDGIITEDKLGLENIYIQAKRYNVNKVPPREIRDFIGAMAIKGARKGVFVTTSEFSAQAKKHAYDAQGMNITLVDGVMLSNLLVQHQMGIAKVENYTVYKVDQNFFTSD